MTFSKWKSVVRALAKPRPVEPPYSHITQIGDPVLRQKAIDIPVETIKSAEVQSLVKHMIEVMRKFELVGLACNQIGMPYRIITMELTQKSLKKFEPAVQKAREMTLVPLTVVINPAYKATNFEKVTFREGCGSVNGFSAEVPRYRSVDLSGFNENGEAIEHELVGWSARIAQHEIDHLDGKLCTDKMDPKSLIFTNWENVNRLGGRIKLPFYRD